MTVLPSDWLADSTANARGSNAEEVQFHYDLSNEFFQLWQEPGLQLRLFRAGEHDV
jgi:cyclopropane fatty-acyl-phospholipid synthase-like methyltransferase